MYSTIENGAYHGQCSDQEVWMSSKMQRMMLVKFLILFFKHLSRNSNQTDVQLNKLLRIEECKTSTGLC